MMIEARIFSKDCLLWSHDKKTIQEISNRLGWLDCIDFSQQHISEIMEFVSTVRASGFETVVLLGMGGSGLAPEVFTRVFPKQKKGLKLFVLDSTCAEQILLLEKQIEFSKTLFIVSSKSGNTIETKSLYQYFYSKVQRYNADQAGRQFVAITDQGSDLQQIAKQQNFLKCFINPSDIGGRFSALSFFGLVPAALLDLSVEKLLGRAQIALEECRESSNNDSSGSALGNWLYQGYHEQQLDKLLIVTDERLQPLYWWIEQLVAESLGKQGEGLFPISIAKGSKQLENKYAKVLYLNFGEAGINVESEKKVSWSLKDEYDVAAQFFYWEFATAIAAAHMQLNPFDEPNVIEAKVQTKEILDSADGKIINAPLMGSAKDVFSKVQEDSYIGVLAYLPISLANRAVLSNFADRIEKQTETMVSVNFGSRYLHSTGQIHKGGKKQGVFLIIIEKSQPQINIPGQNYSFESLCRAQAFGDCQALASKGLPVSVLEIDSIMDLDRIDLL